MVFDRITIYGDEYPIKFGNGAVKRFCYAQDPPIEDYDLFFKIIQGWNLKKVSFNMLDSMAFLVKCAIESAADLQGNPDEISQDWILEWFGDDLEAFPAVIKLLIKEVPQEKKTQKKKSPGGV